jgi:hypothetical protein
VVQELPIKVMQVVILYLQDPQIFLLVVVVVLAVWGDLN